MCIFEIYRHTILRNFDIFVGDFCNISGLFGSKIPAVCSELVTTCVGDTHTHTQTDGG